VAAVFARQPSGALTSLVKQLDAATGEKKIKSFVVFLNDDEKLADQLKDLAKSEGIKGTVFAIDNPAGPKDYNIAKDADVTVLLYSKHKVVVNHAFRKGEFNEAAAAKVAGELDKITKK
jgi:hypothetical protein